MRGIVTAQYLQVEQVRHSHPVIIYSDKTIHGDGNISLGVGTGGGRASWVKPSPSSAVRSPVAVRLYIIPRWPPRQWMSSTFNKWSRRKKGGGSRASPAARVRPHVRRTICVPRAAIYLASDEDIPCIGGGGGGGGDCGGGPLWGGDDALPFSF